MIVLYLHVAATLYMTGLIWFVQLVHYPLMARVGEQVFAEYEVEHQRRTGWAVGPAMLIEMVTAVWLLIMPVETLGPTIGWIGLGLLVVIWISTAAVQVPLHRKLEVGFNPHFIRQLATTNWLRTVLWSARSVLLLVAMASA
jgi:uncharacterized membrane protein